MNSETNDLYPCSPKHHEWVDVIVAGGGPAGIGAALAAAVQGARTLLLEARSQFGGTATAAMWMEIDDFQIDRLFARSKGAWYNVSRQYLQGLPSSLHAVRCPTRAWHRRHRELT